MSKMKSFSVLLALTATLLGACAPSSGPSGTLVNRTPDADVYKAQDSSLIPALRYPGTAYQIRQAPKEDAFLTGMFKESSPYRCAAFEHVFWRDTTDYQTRTQEVESRLKNLGFTLERVGANAESSYGVFSKRDDLYAYSFDFGDGLVFFDFCRTERKSTGGTVTLAPAAGL